MRALSQNMLDALAGSASDARIRCHAWYDGKLVYPDLPVDGWSMNWSSGDQNLIQGQASFTIGDQTGELAPWGYDEPLSAAGSQIQTVFEVGGEAVDLGQWVVARNTPGEMWRLFNDGVTWVPGGATVPVEADELTLLIADDRFLAPESPPKGATVFSELHRILDDIVGLEFTGVTDRGVPKNMVYPEERINTAYDLARMIGEVRMTGTGKFEVYNPARTAPVWTIRGGEGGALVKVQRSQDRASLYNAVVSNSQSTETEIRKMAFRDQGPLRFDGPLGRKPRFKTAMAETPAGVQADADTTLANQVINTSTLLDVYCTPNPAVQTGDWGRIAQPIIGGREFPLDGRATAVKLSGSTSGLDDMHLVVECSTADIEAVAKQVRRGS